MAGHETGQIYTLRIDNHSLLVVASGFNKPSSLALDPISGDLLIYDSFSPPFVNVTVSGADKPGQDFTRCPGCLGKR